MKTKLKLIPVLILLGSGIVLSILPSCEKVKDAAQIKVKFELPDQHFTIDSISHLKTEQLLFTQAFDVNIDSIVGANNGLLSNISFYQFRLSVVSPDDVTLNWLNSARVTVSPEGELPIEVASTVSISSTARSIDFEVKNLELATEIKKPFVLSVYGDLNGPLPAETMEMLLESGIQVSIDPL